MAKQKTYTTQRIILRPLGLRDFKTWCEAQAKSLPKQNEWDRDPTPPKKWKYEFYKERILKHREDATKDVAYIWTMFSRKTGEMLGWIDVSTIHREPYQMANLGYFVFNHHRGNGYAVEATRRVIQAAFEDLKFHRLEAVTDIPNKASIAIAKKCGLYREGIKKHYWYQNGRWEDQLVFIATPELFQARKPSRKTRLRSALNRGS